ncbi:MAG: carbohydrate kinase [Planctomycetaceae bacterium]|jgi:L-xylulokinase|nr:carbohydrate kinase [Planctomycetaceae bacterium]
MKKYLIGVDCGSTMVKAAVFDSAGKEYATASRKVEHIYLHSGWTENNMDALWNGVCITIREVLQRSEIEPRQIACVACTGHGNGLYLVAHDGTPARNGIISSDSRARKYIEEWTRENLLDRLLPKTMQTIWAAQPNALLRWLMDNEPETLAKTKYLFMCKDFVRYRLTGEAYMELSDMSGTSLIDVGKAAYDDEILDAWGILDWKKIMPPLRRSADICGTITREAASATGLAEGTPVAGGMFDIDACGLAVGMTDESLFCMVAGTWGNNQFISKTPVADPDMFMTSCYSIDGYYLMLEGSATSASNLEWFVSQFFESDRELLKLKGMTKSVYDHCGELVLQTQPSDSAILFLPYLYGGPVSLDAKGCLFGLDGRQTRSHVLRAVFEGIIFGHRWHLTRLTRFCERPKTIRLTGGAANSSVWSQMFADVFQIPVEIPAGAELGCLGAAICGAYATGLYPSYESACQNMVVIDRVYPPNPAFAEIYDEKYGRYLKLLEILQPVWHELTPS